MEQGHLLFIVLVLVLAGFVQGLTGFGFGLVAMALMPLFVDLHTATTLVVIFNLATTTVTSLLTYRHFPVRQGGKLLLGACLGVPVGFYLLVKTPQALLLHLLGIVMVLFAANELSFARRTRIDVPGNWAFPIGFLSGGLGGAFNIGGPPAVAYVFSQAWTKEQGIAALQILFLLSGAMRLALSGATGMVTPGLLMASLRAFPAVLLAIGAGMLLLRRVEEQKLKTAIFCFLGIMGLKYALFA